MRARLFAPKLRGNWIRDSNPGLRASAAARMRVESEKCELDSSLRSSEAGYEIRTRASELPRLRGCDLESEKCELLRSEAPRQRDTRSEPWPPSFRGCADASLSLRKRARLFASEAPRLRGNWIR